MFGLDNPVHILFLLAILLLVFGAKRLPEMGRSLGEGLRGFKETISGDSSPKGEQLTAATPMPAADPVAEAAADSAPVRPVA